MKKKLLIANKLLEV